VRCRHEQAKYLEELDGAKVEDPTGKAKVGHAAFAPQPKLDIILGGVVLLSGQNRGRSRSRAGLWRRRVSVQVRARV